MVCVNRLSKMVHLIPCHKTITSEMAARKYHDHIWKDFGLPSHIISDRGPQFISSFTRALNSLLGITKNFSTSRHPQTDGQTEHSNQELEQYLRIFCGKHQHDWAEWIACTEFSINNKINSSMGYSPFFLNYSRNPHRPLLPLHTSPSGVPHADSFAKQMSELAKETSAALSLASAAMKHSYDKWHQPSPPLPPGSFVLLDSKGLDTKSPSQKLNDKRFSPFEVLEQIGEVSYRLLLPSSWKIHDVFHVSRLVLFRTPSFPSQSLNTLVSLPSLDIPNECSLVKILLHKHLHRKIIYIVLLTGDNPEDTQWISHDDLSKLPNPDNVLQTFLSSLN